LNEAIKEKLRDFNDKPFQKKDGSRAILFANEQPFLMPLPQYPFELSTWKIATVPPGYHIGVDSQNYSVPFEYIGQKVDVRLTRNTVEIFFDGNRICSHKRVYGKMGQYSTNNAHMPPDHQKYITWSSEKFVEDAVKIGKNTLTVIQLFLTSEKVEQKSHKTCKSLLQLADKHTPERLEAACAKALSYTQRPTIKIIQAVSKSTNILAEDVKNEPSKATEYGFVRGAEYYRRDS
jgi:hypothetical protein